MLQWFLQKACFWPSNKEIIKGHGAGPLSGSLAPLSRNSWGLSCLNHVIVVSENLRHKLNDKQGQLGVDVQWLLIASTTVSQLVKFHHSSVCTTNCNLVHLISYKMQVCFISFSCSKIVPWTFIITHQKCFRKQKIANITGGKYKTSESRQVTEFTIVSCHN